MPLMAATYDAGSISQSGRDLVRFMVGDTGPDSWLFQDEEIDGVLMLANSQTLRAAVLLCRRMAAHLASNEVLSRNIGDLAISIRGGADAWAKFADELETFGREGMSMSKIGIAAGGIPYGETQPIFRLGQHDNPGASPAWSPQVDTRWDR